MPGRIWRAPLGAFGLLLVGGASLLAPWLAPHDPTSLDLGRRLLPVGPGHPLGTDHLGRDLLSRLLYGGQLTLGSAALATTLSLLLGVSAGLLAGYLGGWPDLLIGGAGEVALALPGLTLALALVGLLGPSLGAAILALAAVGWPSYARLVRASTLALREQPFVLAARSIGASDSRLLRVHLLPSLLGPIAVLGSHELATGLIALAGLGFLGLGAQPPTPEWGVMLADGRTLIGSEPRLALLPGACLALSALCAQLAGDELRDRLSARGRPLIEQLEPERQSVG